MPQQDPNLGTVNPSTAGRLAALGGLGFAVASIAGDLAIGPFPRPAPPASQLVPFYAAHQPRPHLTHAITVPAEGVHHA